MKEKVFSDWYHQTRDITARAGFDAAWQHQQAKVDELETEWLDMNQQHEQAVKECFEVNSENRKLQAKVEELQKQLIEQGQRFNDQAQRVKDLEHKNGELQKRVGKAIEAINEHYDSDGMSGLYFMDLKEILEGEQALKGEGNA